MAPNNLDSIVCHGDDLGTSQYSHGAGLTRVAVPTTLRAFYQEDCDVVLIFKAERKRHGVGMVTIS